MSNEERMQCKFSPLIYLISLLVVCPCIGQKRSKDNAVLSEIENGLTITATLNGINGNYSIQDRMEYYGVPGVSISVMNGDKIDLKASYGVSRKKDEKGIDSNTLFQAASIGKPITSFAIFRLVQSGLLSLDTDVNDYLKGWQIDYSNYSDTAKVTLRQIISHTSGLSRGSVAYYSIGEEIPDNEIDMLDANPPAKLEPVKLEFEPGTDWSYSGGGYTVLQKIIQDVLNVGFEKAMDSLVFKPLEMHRSFFDPSFSDTSTNVALGYNYDGTLVESGWMILTDLAAGGLWTTPNDILKFVSAFSTSLKGEAVGFLTKELADEMLDLGLFVDDKGTPTIFSFRGTNKGYRSEFIGFIENGRANGAVVMTNSYNSRYLIQEILRSISNHYKWRYPFAKEPKEYSVVSLDDKKLFQFKGRYKSESRDYVIELTSRDSLLMVSREWNGRFTYMNPTSDSSFVDPTTLQEFAFLRNSSNEFTRLIINGKSTYIKIK
ncbi:serine hydrolase domain-containing protein [Ekhidna sp.]